MNTIKHSVRQFMADDEGATLIEYGMMVLLITVLSVAFITTIGTKVSSGFQNVSLQLP